MYKESLFLCFVFFAWHNAKAAKKEVLILTENNWSDMLEGEWMVKLLKTIKAEHGIFRNKLDRKNVHYAPWCPACRDMAESWKDFATWQDDLGFKCAEIDVTENPALSGRFMVTSLPTVYHVINGEFRKYQGERRSESFVEFVDDAKWKEQTVLPWYTSPTSPHMAAVGYFFKLSLAIRDLHNRMTSEFGIPVWGSYVIFAVVTIVVGLFLGLCCVCLCDCCCPPPPPPTRYKEPLRYTRGPAAHPPAADDDDSDNIHDDREEPKKDREEPKKDEATGGDIRPAPTRKRTVQKE